MREFVDKVRGAVAELNLALCNASENGIQVEIEILYLNNISGTQKPFVTAFIKEQL